MDYAYPLTQKAITNTAEVFRLMGGDIPAQLVHTLQRIATIIDGSTTRPLHEKDALIAASVLALSPVFVPTGEDRPFAKEYNDHVQTIMDEMMTLEPGKPQSTDIGQIGAAIGIASMEGIIFAAQNKMLGPEHVAGVSALLARANEEEKAFLPALNAPALAALYQDTKVELAIAISPLLPKPGDKTQPGGPSSNKPKAP